MSLTIDDIHAVRFASPALGTRGYDERDVDSFLDAVIDALDGCRELTVTDVHNVEFSRAPLLRRGYDEQQVDSFLDAIADALQAQPRQERTCGAG